MGRKPSFDRADVIQKALTLFWTKGYHATSLKDLEEALDMRPGSIYAAFGSKENIFDEALRQYAASSRALLDESLSSAPSKVMGLANYVRNMGCADAKETPARACMLMKTVLETPDDDPVLRQSAEELIRDVEAGFAAVFEEAKSAGELPCDANPDRLASWLLTQTFGLGAYAQRSDATERLLMLTEDIAQDIERLQKVAPD